MPLSNGQQRFFELLEKSSVSDSIQGFFDKKKRSVDIDRVEAQMGVLSDGEQIMLKFFINLWLGKDHFDFHLMHAASTLDLGNKEIISEWFESPFWP